MQIQPPIHRYALMFIEHAPVIAGQGFDLSIHPTFKTVRCSFHQPFHCFWWINEGEQVSLADEFFQQFVGTAVTVMGVPPGGVVAGEFWYLICENILFVGLVT